MDAPTPHTILIADDLPVIRASLKRHLTKAGYDVVEAADGRQAIDRLDDRVDLALLDMRMPEMDGMDCLRHIREHRPELAAVMITASDDVGDAVEAMKTGAFDYVTKPVDFEGLGRVVRRALKSTEQARRLRQVEARLAQARERENQTANRIQQNLLLGRPPDDLTGAHVAELMISSRTVGGDFYDFQQPAPDCLDVVVGDVMGKGVPAALLGAAIKQRTGQALYELLRRGGVEAAPPDAIMGHVRNSMIGELAEIEAFATLCYARFDFQRAEVRFVDCGHMPTIVRRADRGVCETLKGTNMPLGFPDPAPFDLCTASFGPGDVFVFYSDGVTEAADPQGEQFEGERLEHVVAEHGGGVPEKLIQRIRREVADFTRSETYADDLTVVVVAIAEADEAEKSVCRHMEASSDLNELARFRQFVVEACPEASEDDRTALALALTEAVTNVIRHAYRGRGDGRLRLEVRADARRVRVDLFDWGEPFDPAAAPPPSFDGSRDGGFGLHIIRELMDRVDYARDPGGRNRTTLIKIWTEEEDHGTQD